MAQIEATLERLATVLENRTPPPAPPVPSPAAPAPDLDPGVFANIVPGAKSVLRPNPPFVFDGDRTQGRAFLHSVRTYARLLPEAFIENGEPSEEKLVRFALSFMAKDSAQRWSERHSSKPQFPFPTWAAFITEFRLRFVEENEQDHALQKLESRSYFMGSRDVFKYTDDFEELVDLAGFEDPLVKVTKFRSGLDPAINLAITGSSDPPDLRDYPAWRLRAYRQYESLLRAKAASNVVSGRVRPTPQLFKVANPLYNLSNTAGPAHRTAAPPLPPAVPMDIDRARARNPTRRGCFRCGDPNHFARDCTTPVDVRTVDVLDEVIQQLGADMLDELVARLASAEVVAEHAAAVAQEDFPSRAE
jgi:hypothetical protein